MTKCYKVSDIKKLVLEGLDYNPKKGTNVDSEDKKNNEKAYKDAEKQAKEIGAELKKTDKNNNPVKYTTDTFDQDDNKNTLDVDFDYNPGDNYKNRVKAQVKGFNSELEEDSDTERNADFEGAEEFYDVIKKKHGESAKRKEMAKASGLAARTYPSDTFKKQSVFGENKEQAPKNKMKRINFKKTVFLQKEDVEKYIPEEYKKDGNKFIMRDAERTEYMVEWKANAKPDVKLYINEEQKTKDEFARIHELFGYKRVDGKSTVSERAQSRYDFDKMLAEARKL